MSFLDEIDAEVREAGLDKAIVGGHTPPVFNWLLSMFSHQGISDRVARSYMERHGTASWSEIEAALRLPVLGRCPLAFIGRVVRENRISERMGRI
jgi:hypothetical protein